MDTTITDLPDIDPALTGSVGTDADLKYEVDVEDAGPARKKLTITVRAGEIDEKIDDSYSTLMAEATLPGFRKGRAPRKLIERRFGSTVKQEARNQLIAQAYSKAIEDQKIRVVGEPEGDELADIDIEPGKDLTFTVEVEVAPDITLPPLEGVEVKKPIVVVTDEHIQAELDRQLIRHGEQVELEKGDEIGPICRLVGRAVVLDVESNEQISELPEAVVAMPLRREEPKGHLLGLFVDDMFALFKGKRVGDTIVHETAIPDTDERPSLRGKKVRVEFTINGGARVEPASSQDVIAFYSLDDEDALKNEIRQALEDRAQQEQKSAMHEQIGEYLADKTEVALPEKLSARQAQRSLDRYRVEMLYRGVPADEVETRIAEVRQESDDAAQRRLKMFFVLNELAEHFNVEVNEGEVNGRIASIAMQRGERPEQLRAELQRNGRLQQIALQIREHKCLDRILDTARVVEITADEWNKTVEERKTTQRQKKTKKG